jgi:hypothetical protein
MNAYFIHTGSEQTGPYTLEELKSKGISKDSLIWREELTDWIKAGELPELNVLFIPVPPPFVKKELTTESTEKAAFPPTQMRKEKKYRSVLLPLLIILVAAGIYFYLNSGKNKNSDVNKEKIVAVANDTLIKKDTVKADTAKKINLDTLSNWMVKDTVSHQKNDTSNQTDFTMGGIPVHKDNAKKKVKKETIQPEEKKPDKKINVNTETQEITPVKKLLISGSFRKNLLFEAVLEGKIQNPNNNISFRNIIVTVQFLSSDGESLGTKQFTQNGVLRSGETISFKFKTNAPKGTKVARYAIAGSGF